MSSAYCTTDDLEQKWGATNLDKWADLDNDQDAVKMAARKAKAIEVASESVNDQLRGGPYVIPFSDAPATPILIVEVACQLAGVWLYENRGVQDYNTEDGSPVHRLSWHKKDARKKLLQLKAGTVKINATSYTAIPEKVSYTRSESGGIDD